MFKKKKIFAMDDELPGEEEDIFKEYDGDDEMFEDDGEEEYDEEEYGEEEVEKKVKRVRNYYKIGFYLLLFPTVFSIAAFVILLVICGISYWGW